MSKRSYAEKCEAIIAWAEDRDDFDTGMVESVAGQIESGRELSWKQEQAIDNIIERWHIDIEDYLE